MTTVLMSNTVITHNLWTNLNNGDKHNVMSYEISNKAALF